MNYLREAMGFSVLVGVFAAAASVGGCSSRADPSSEAQNGAVSMQLTGQTNGNSYRLRNARFDVSGPTMTVFDSETDLTLTTLNATLSTGNYTITLEPGWSLEKLIDGTFQVVDATLTSPNPQSFQILGGATTNEAYQFSTNGTVVTIGSGQLDLSIGVTENGGCQSPDWTLGGTPDVDDPRWQGATGVSFPDLLSQGAIAAKSRLVESSGTLFLQLRTLTDAAPGNSIAPTGTTLYRDSVYVAFADATLATIEVVRVAIDNTGATHSTRWMKSGGTWTSGPASAGAPVWLSGLTAWVNPPVSGPEQVSWAVDFKIATASAPGTKFWYATVISPGAIGAVQAYAWPNRGGFVEPSPPDTGALSSTWGQQFDAIGAANWGDYTASLAKSCSP